MIKHDKNVDEPGYTGNYSINQERHGFKNLAGQGWMRINEKERTRISGAEMWIDGEPVDGEGETRRNLQKV